MASINIHNVDCLEFMAGQADQSYDCVFADPPDNIGLKYDNYLDYITPEDYYNWLGKVLESMCRVARGVAWLSFSSRHIPRVAAMPTPKGFDPRYMIWRFTFGQYRDLDHASGFRPILRLARHGWQPNVDPIREPSQRMRTGDKRAAGMRVPDDVWEFPRVVGNAKERRKWHSTQHPEALMRRILLISQPRDRPYRILDGFLGSGTTAIVASRLDGSVELDGCELSSEYCTRIARELGAT